MNRETPVKELLEMLDNNTSAMDWFYTDTDGREYDKPPEELFSVERDMVYTNTIRQQIIKEVDNKWCCESHFAHPREAFDTMEEAMQAFDEVEDPFAKTPMILPITITLTQYDSNFWQWTVEGSGGFNVKTWHSKGVYFRQEDARTEALLIAKVRFGEHLDITTETHLSDS